MSIKHTRDLVMAENLLEEALEAFNMIRNQQYAKGSKKDTYSLASKISKFLKRDNEKIKRDGYDRGNSTTSSEERPWTT